MKLIYPDEMIKRYLKEDILTKDMICLNAQQRAQAIYDRLRHRPIILSEGQRFLLNWKFPGLFPEVQNPQSEEESFMQLELTDSPVILSPQKIKKCLNYMRFIITNYNPQIPDAAPRVQLTDYHCGECGEKIPRANAIWLTVDCVATPFCCEECRLFFSIKHPQTDFIT